MLKAGYAQEVITPPTGVGLAGYFNERPNTGMYDDLLVKVVALEIDGKRTALVTLELCSITKVMFDAIKARVDGEFGEGLYENLLICATHTHTGPKYLNKPQQENEVTQYAFDMTVDSVVRALKRAFMNLLPAELEAAKVFNNPYGFVRRYWMTSGDIVTNPGWRNPGIDKPECDYDRTINILAVRQCGRIAALICNIANHGDTIGGNLVSADWYGRFTQEIQHELKCSLPVLVLDDASGNINHFDFRQEINQTGYHEAVRVGRGYARIVLDALPALEPIAADELRIRNSTVTIPHRRLTDAEVAEAQHILDTVPDIKKEGAAYDLPIAIGIRGPALLRQTGSGLQGQEHPFPRLPPDGHRDREGSGLHFAPRRALQRHFRSDPQGEPLQIHFRGGTGPVAFRLRAHEGVFRTGRLRSPAGHRHRGPRGRRSDHRRGRQKHLRHSTQEVKRGLL